MTPRRIPPWDRLNSSGLKGLVGVLPHAISTALMPSSRSALFWEQALPIVESQAECATKVLREPDQAIRSPISRELPSQLSR